MSDDPDEEDANATEKRRDLRLFGVALKFLPQNAYGVPLFVEDVIEFLNTDGNQPRPVPFCVLKRNR